MSETALEAVTSIEIYDLAYQLHFRLSTIFSGTLAGGLQNKQTSIKDGRFDSTVSRFPMSFSTNHIQTYGDYSTHQVNLATKHFGP